MLLDARLKLFLWLAATFVTCLLVGDLIGGKFYEFELGGTGFFISVGMIPFPVVFLLTDLLNEFYGQRATRFVTLVGFAMAWLTIGVLAVADVVPWAERTRAANWDGMRPAAFDNVFTSGTHILMASTFAYLIAQLVDIAVFQTLKRRTGGRMLWLRATGSTMISQLIDTVVINAIVWGDLLPVSVVLSFILTSYFAKAIAAVALTPLIYAGHALVERRFDLAPVPIEPDDPVSS